MAVKQRIDIEDLLIWAYRAQCVDKVMSKRFTPKGPSSSPVSGLAQVLALGTRVDTSGFAASVLGSHAPDDAMTVHDAVLGLRTVYLEWLEDDDVGLWDSESAQAQGCSIERRGPDLLLRRPDDTTASLMLAEPTALIIQYARDGGRPDWHEGWRQSAGRSPGDDEAKDKWGRRRKKYTGYTVEHVMTARALYGVWWAALGVLVAELAGSLEEFDVTGPIAPESPWMMRDRNVIEGGKFAEFKTP